jgi:hypothetical protein
MTQTKTENNNSFEGLYDEALQRILIAHLVADHDTFNRCRHHVKVEYFNDILRKVIRLIIKHETDTGNLPSTEYLQARTKIELKSIADLKMPLDPPWFLAEYEKFARYKALENVVLEGYDLLQQGKDADIVKRSSDAMAISLTDRKHKFDRQTLTQTLAKPIPQWLFKGLCYERGVGVFYGESQTFKSFIVLCLASMLAHGKVWNGRQLKQRNVLYVAGEGGPMIGLRRLAWLKHHDLPIEDDGLDMIPLALNLLDPAEVADFIARMKEYDTKDAFLPLDTLSSMIAGNDENTAEVMSKVIAVANQIAAELNCCVLLVHHTGRDGDKARGSYALFANADFEWKAIRMNEMLVKVQVTKQKDGSLPHFFFQAHKVMLGIKDEDGIERDSLALVPVTEAEMAHTVQPGEIISQAEGDCRSMAMAMDPGQTLTRAQLVRSVMKALNVKERACERRIDAALPLNQMVETTRGDDKVVLTRTKSDAKGFLIEMVVSLT